MTPTLTILATLDGTDGAEPEAPLVIDADGDLIGTATVGGANGDGTVFELAKTATGYASTPTTLVSFDISDGMQPDGSLIFDSSGDLLTTTEEGGAGGNYYISGTVIEIPLTAGVYASTATVLANFDVANFADGADPEGGLLADASGDLFGTTIYGGTSPAYGTVFELANTPGSTPDPLVTFDGLDGSEPYGTLIADANGDLFGVTAFGGSGFSSGHNLSGYGVVFEIVKTAGGYASTPTILADFTSSSGEYPGEGLVADANGDLFGVTESGGTYGDGTIFEIAKTAGGYSPLITLASFNGTDGKLPQSALLIDADGNLFGATETTVFELAKTATSYATTPIVLANVADEIGGLTADAEGDLFGTEATTGPGGDGSIFEITDTGFVTNNIYWNGGTGSWDVATNWTPQQVPNSTNFVYIVAAGINVVNTSAAGGDAAGTLTISASSTLNIPTSLTVETALTNSGNVNVDDGAELLVAGTLDDAGAGTVALDSTGDLTMLQLVGGVTFEGTGTVALSSNANNRIASNGSSATLNNTSNISGAGQIGDGDTTLTLINEQGGIIDGTGAAPLIIDTGANTITNDGTLETTVANSVLQIESDVDNLGGTVAAICTDAATNSLVVLNRMTIAGGTLTTSGTGDIDPVYATLDGASQGTLTNSGPLEVVGTLTLEGTIDNTGSVRLLFTITNPSLLIDGNVRLDGSGTVTLGGPSAEIVSNGAAATLTNSNTITGAGTIGDAFLTLNNQGVIDATGTNSLVINTGTKVITNDGTLGEQAGGVLDIASAVNGSGSAVIQIGTVELGGSFAEDTSFTAGDAGTLQIDHYALFDGTISGFTVGDTIDLGDVKYDPAWTAGIEPNSNNVLQFVENGATYTLNLDPADDFVGHDFLLSSIDGGAGTAITVGQVPITGTVTIPAGETALDVVVGNGGELIVAPGGSEMGATVTNGGTLNVENDASASGGTVSSGGTLNVSSGGTASGITVSDGGHQYVEFGGTADDTVLTDPGIQIVVSGGTASNTVDGGEQDVYGSAVSTTVINGGLEIVETGGFATGTTVSSTGDLTVDSGGIVAGDTLMIAGGEVILDAGAVVSSGASFSFSGVGNTLQIDGSALPAAVISGFVTGDTIALPGAAGGSIGTVDASPGATSVEILDSQGDDLGTLDLDGNYPLANLALDGSGNLTTDQGVPCYCPGTLIKTKRGQKKVEELRIGDSVMTASGAARPIKWIGRRSYSGRLVMGRKDILPVCIKAGALDDDVPKRDLWISPNHAMYFENNGGVLVEAKDLVNGVSIVQVAGVEKVEYVHIELDTHDVIIAEGALSETFIDDDNRGMFHNARDYRALYPAAITSLARYCAPRLDEGYEVEVIRQRLASRAGLILAETRMGSLRGYIDRVSTDCVAGWAQNIDHPEASVCLDIYSGGGLIAQVLANGYREDLQRAGLGHGRHGFKFVPPKDVWLDRIEVRRSLDGAALLLTAEAKRKLILSAA